MKFKTGELKAKIKKKIRLGRDDKTIIKDNIEITQNGGTEKVCLQNHVLRGF